MRINGNPPRRSDWPLLLEIYIDQTAHKAFAWGTHDCVSFAIGWLALVRQDLRPIEDLALDYDSAPEALRALAGRSVEAAVNDWGGLASVHPSYAQRGDIVLVQILDRACLAVCVGESAAGPGMPFYRCSRQRGTRNHPQPFPLPT